MLSQTDEITRTVRKIDAIISGLEGELDDLIVERSQGLMVAYRWSQGLQRIRLSLEGPTLHLVGWDIEPTSPKISDKLEQLLAIVESHVMQLA